MSFDDIVRELQEMTEEKRKLQNAKRGLGDNNLGIPLGKLRVFGKKMGKDHEKGIRLWDSGVYEEMLLGTMMMDADKLDEKAVESMMEKAFINELVDEFSFNTIANMTGTKNIADKWMKSKDDKQGRGGWNIQITRLINGQMDSDEKEEILTYIDNNLRDAKEGTRWAMNRCLCEIGIRHKSFRGRALEIGERLEVYKDMKVSKGCISAYAPSWIYAVVSKNKKETAKESTPIDEYIDIQPMDRQERLRYLREIILGVIPDAQEKIAWGMPTFRFKDRNCIHFANNKNHIGIYPGAGAIEEFKDRLEDYNYSKGAIHLPLDRPFPKELIQKIVAYSMEENRKRKKCDSKSK